MTAAGNDPAVGQASEPLVLLVAIDPDSRAAYATSLSGFRVATVADGVSALACVAALEPSIVVADLRLAAANGLELCRRLKTGDASAAVPVIALAAGARRRDLELARAAGFDRVLRKPCAPAGLRRAIETLLARSARERQRSVKAAQRSSALCMRAGAAALQGWVLQCRDAASRGERACVPCPSCSSPIRWRDRQAIGGIDFDYFAACPAGCGEFWFDHLRRRFTRLR